MHTALLAFDELALQKWKAARAAIVLAAQSLFNFYFKSIILMVLW